MIKRLTDPAAAQAKVDDETLFNIVLAELERANPAWRASLAPAAKAVLARRAARRPAP
mgnify:CR=1 FL=1